MIAEFDGYILRFMGSFAHQSEVFDRFVVHTLSAPTFKFGPIIVCMWMMWFSRADREKARVTALATAAATLLALLIGRLIQNLGPQRPRPVYADNPDFVAPYNISHDVVKDWSSFPSDNAAMAFALSTGVFYFSRRLGIFCYLWAAIIVCLPRIYGGLHYASDIVAAAVIGTVTFIGIYRWKSLTAKLSSWASTLEAKHTEAFYAAAFLLSYQIMTMFDDIRNPLQSLWAHWQG